jgi:hypothetical protein
MQATHCGVRALRKAVSTDDRLFTVVDSLSIFFAHISYDHLLLSLAQ